MKQRGTVRSRKHKSQVHRKNSSPYEKLRLEKEEEAKCIRMKNTNGSLIY